MAENFSSEFSPPVAKEARFLKQNPPPPGERRDFRRITTFTIDPADAKDFDDAISFRKLTETEDRYEVGVHIADVSHYVRPGTALDKEALRRGTSIYLVDQTIPMLPAALSNDLCSLNPYEEKLTFSVVFELNKKGGVLKKWFGRTIIKSNKRFSYEEAQEILDGKKGMFYEELNILNQIAESLRKKRFEAGAISLDQEEIKFTLDEKGTPIKIEKKARGPSHKLIEELMLLANRKVAECFTTERKKDTFVYRVHDKPDKGKMSELHLLLRQMGYKVKLKDGLIPPEEINALIENLEGKSEKDTVQTAIVRSMAKAAYSTKNIGHHGLAFERYTHFTSPIRRYPDIMTHRLLDNYLKGKPVGRDEWKEYEKKAKISSEREREAQEAEWASVKYKQTEYMSYRLGQEFEGVVISLVEWGLFVAERETKSEGLIKFSAMAGDYYYFDRKQMAAIGKKTKNRYKIGDRIKIKLTGVDLARKTINYEIL